VFNPVVFKLKKQPQPVALAAATTAVFLATWLSHAYQSFWLRGAWGFTVPDAVFWGVLGGLVMVNVQLDARKKPAPRLKPGADAPPTGVDYKALAVRCLKTLATFVTIILLWALWSSPSVADWLDLLARGLRAS